MKYVLKGTGVKGEAFTEVILNKGEPKWNYASLAVGNWFSVTNYFKVTAIAGDKVQTRCNSKDVTVSKDILEYEMYNAAVF